MVSLYIDTTDHIELGLLGKNLEWISYEIINEKKSSSLIHGLIYNLLRENHLEIQEIETIFYVAGPGSYTGIRLSYGFSQILEYLNKKVFSFYHFQVPFFLGHKSGVWSNHAFKGEIFVYEWSDEKNFSHLLTKDEFHEKYKNLWINSPEYFFYNSPSTFIHDFHWQDQTLCQYTSKIIEENSTQLFSGILKLQLKQQPFYYRPLEKEFKCSIGEIKF